MTELDKKICDVFQEVVVRKDLANEIKGNAVVPTYVLEYLLAHHCTTSDEDSIRSGVEATKEMLQEHYFSKRDAELIKIKISTKGRHTVIDKVQVTLNANNDTIEASFSNLGVSKVPVDRMTIKDHPKLAVAGVWCIANLEYEFVEGTPIPWRLSQLKPIQMSRINKEDYLAGRKQFTTDEWIDFILQSIGFNPDMFGKRNKLFHLVRLIPFCERNYNLIELGPKGTGKSHIYSDFSPYGILISGGEVTVPRLFVNEARRKIGLVGHWDTVAFDEFAGKKKVDSALVDIMKNYMANKTFSRGGDTYEAEASMVFVGNTRRTLLAMLKHFDLFIDLPKEYHDSAFLDRLHFYIPGWETEILRAEMFTSGYGFVVDYIAEILRHLRNDDYSDRYTKHFSLPYVDTRDRVGINKTFSGLMKIIFPDGEATKEEIEELLRFSIEGRKRVKDQLLRIDPTFTNVVSSYTDIATGTSHEVKTLEEIHNPRFYRSSSETDDVPLVTSSSDKNIEEPLQEEVVSPTAVSLVVPKPTPRHLDINENQKGISFDDLFGPYLRGAKKIEIIDPYIRNFPQQRNLMEFLETVVKFNTLEEEITVHLVTEKDANNEQQQIDNFEKIDISCSSLGIIFTWEFASDSSRSIHDRFIITDTGWKIVLGRGLDMFQPCGSDVFIFASRMQSQRSCRAFSITFLRHPQ